jgi:hypothetical protein
MSALHIIETLSVAFSAQAFCIGALRTPAPQPRLPRRRVTRPQLVTMSGGGNGSKGGGKGGGGYGSSSGRDSDADRAYNGLHFEGYHNIRVRTAAEDEDWRRAQAMLVLESPTDSEDDQLHEDERLIVERAVQREVDALRHRAESTPPIGFKAFAGKAFSITDTVEGTSWGYRATLEEQ